MTLLHCQPTEDVRVLTVALMEIRVLVCYAVSTGTKLQMFRRMASFKLQRQAVRAVRKR